ncbi:hypothetical protein IMW82_14680 [Rhodanobacter sp. B2A1Ga4]|jgi:hypothetical protein|uniref:hypothetical protein n=1 Tax=Rhodanobacter sp. B2A1Ga4 TaxID=2778647 RepID=UPI001B36FA67|nr:hypothetical protein [Rhodanobacter sp. B2A1Ga4]MBQ4855913.1 hypothetical protein [Rhodanobacter sp. B2A1Ga4]
MAFGEANKRHEVPYFSTTAEQLIAEARADIAPGAVMNWARQSGLYNLISGTAAAPESANGPA